MDNTTDIGIAREESLAVAVGALTTDDNSDSLNDLLGPPDKPERPSKKKKTLNLSGIRTIATVPAAVAVLAGIGLTYITGIDRDNGVAALLCLVFALFIALGTALTAMNTAAIVPKKPITHLLVASMMVSVVVFALTMVGANSLALGLSSLAIATTLVAAMQASLDKDKPA